MLLRQGGGEEEEKKEELAQYHCCLYSREYYCHESGGVAEEKTLRVQVPNNHILSEILTYITNYYPKTEYLTIGSFGPLGKHCQCTP